MITGKRFSSFISTISMVFIISMPQYVLASDDDSERGSCHEGDQSSNQCPIANPSLGLTPWVGQAYRKGVVATANPYASEVGAQILEKGGNAIDAAVAIAYSLNVVEPQTSGIGGGGFMMIYLAKSHETFVVDTREKAPAGATPGMFSGLTFAVASSSGIAAGVPGMVKGTALAVDKWGKLDLKDDIKPAIKLADEGFAATPRYVSQPLCTAATSRARVYPETTEFFCPHGATIPVGTIITNKPLAETLRAIAKDGPDAFYSGKIAQGIVDGQLRMAPGGKPGTMTLADLANYNVVIRKPVSSTYRGYTIKSTGSPSSGGLTLLQMLKMVERFPIGNQNAGLGFGTTSTLNIMAGAMRTAYADRAVWMGDSDFSYVPTNGLLNDVYLQLRGALIQGNLRIAPNPVSGNPIPYDVPTSTIGSDAQMVESFSGPGGSTSHIVVVDKWGNIVTYTTTIESNYGSGMFAGNYRPDGTFHSYGFLLNNELTDFNFTPSINPLTGQPATNDVAPGKRPRSSMAPTMIFNPDGEPIYALGSPGGSTIINSVFNMILNLIDHKMAIQDAINAPRMSINSTGSVVSIDTGNPFAPTPFPAASLLGLTGLGYTVTAPADIGSVQLIMIDPDTHKQYGGADLRREGTVIGLPRSCNKKP